MQYEIDPIEAIGKASNRRTMHLNKRHGGFFILRYNVLIVISLSSPRQYLILKP
jgi:hypothetical protein